MKLKVNHGISHICYLIKRCKIKREIAKVFYFKEKLINK